MGNPKVGKSSKGELMHFSVGAVIEQNGKYFLINRAKTPLGWASVAGHIDEGENETIALGRELKEESGLVLEKYKQMAEGEVQNNVCRRGVKTHYWHVFFCEASGEPKIKQDEVKSFGWFSPEEIKKLQLEPVWAYWFKKLKII